MRESKKNILIIDDDVDFAISVEDLLNSFGYKTKVAHDSSSALNLLREHGAGVALVDIKLGTESGLELLETLVSEDPELLCVIVTAFDTTNVSMQVLHDFAYDYLRKPIHPEVLLKSVERCMEKIDMLCRLKQLESKQSNPDEVSVLSQSIN